ncbi:glycosyltransferase family 52 [Edwardsiella tarda]|uniref:glycosyltransferase family 52 n=1 Tax=Edwardsiella tarda TaxID=636 RepID=UPI003B511CAE
MDLYICLTPLQTLIAGKIKQKKNADAQLFYFFAKDNEVNRKYYADLGKHMVESRALFAPLKVKTFIDIYRFVKNKSFDTIYFANIDHPFIHYVLSYANFKRIETFDDGTVNISYSGRYYNDVAQKRWKLVVHTLLRRKFDKNRILNESCLHHTIYKDRKNIIPNTQLVNLFNINDGNDAVSNGEISLFLGGIYSEMLNEKKHVAKLEKNILAFLEKNNNTYYIPHPRESDGLFNSFFLPAAYDNLIAEHIIISLCKKYAKINVYGMASSVQFNMFDMPMVNCIAVKAKHLDAVTSENIAKLMAMGSPCIEI